MSKTTATSGTDAMLKKLETFGKRMTEHLFFERTNVVAETNL